MFSYAGDYTYVLIFLSQPMDMLLPSLQTSIWFGFMCGSGVDEFYWTKSLMVCEYRTVNPKNGDPVLSGAPHTDEP